MPSNMIKSKSHASALSATAETLQSNLVGGAIGSGYALFRREPGSTMWSTELQSDRLRVANASQNQKTIVEEEEVERETGTAMFSDERENMTSPALPAVRNAILPPGTPPLSSKEDGRLIEFARSMFSNLKVSIETGSTGDTGSGLESANPNHHATKDTFTGQFIVHISFQRIKWNRPHSFHEFESLHAQVTASKLFAAPSLPLFPGSRMSATTGETSVSSDGSQRNQLDTYLSALLEIPDFWQCLAVVKFLDTPDRWLETQRHILCQRSRLLELESKVSALQAERDLWQQRCEGHSRTIAMLQAVQGGARQGDSSTAGSPVSGGGFEVGIDELEASPTQLPLPPPGDWSSDFQRAGHRGMVTSASTPHLSSGTHALSGKPANLLSWSLIPASEELSLVERLSMHSTSRERLERHLNAIAARVRPTWDSEMKRKRVFYFVLGLLKRSLGAQAYPIGAVPLRVYVPDEEIGVSAFVCNGQEGRWLVKVGEALMGSQQSDPAPRAEAAADHATGEQQRCQVTSVNFSPTSQRIKCQVEGITVNISANNLEALAQVAFFEEVDRLVGQEHLFKRSLLLLKAWSFYESRDETHENLMSIVPEPMLVTLLIHVFNVYHQRIQSTVQALSIFFLVMSQFDWASAALTATGQVPLAQALSQAHHTQHGFHAELSGNPNRSRADLLLPPELVAKYMERYTKARQERGQTAPGRNSNSRARNQFSASLLNIMNPLDPSHNMGDWCTQRRDLQRFTRAIERGTHKTSRILLHLQRESDLVAVGEGEAQPSINAADSMFSSTLHRFSSGWRPDVDGAAEAREPAAVELGGNFPLAPGAPALGNDVHKIRRVFSVPVHLGEGPLGRSANSQDVMTGNLNEMWSRLRYCSLLLDSEVTGPALLSLATEILAEKGALPVGEIGKMLQEATASPNISSTLKEQFGGLKKFLEQHPDTFLISTDHPFNPKVYLLASLSEAQVQSIKAGTPSGPAPSSGKKRKSGRAKKPATAHPSVEQNASGPLAANGRGHFPHDATHGQAAFNRGGAGRPGAALRQHPQQQNPEPMYSVPLGGMHTMSNHHGMAHGISMANGFGPPSRYGDQNQTFGHGMHVGNRNLTQPVQLRGQQQYGQQVQTSPGMRAPVSRMRGSASMMNLNYGNEF